MKGPAFFAYATNYLIDTDNAIIVDVEASRAIRQAEVGATRTMIARTRDKFGLYPEILTADTAYGAAENLNWLVNKEGIMPHIPVFDKSRRKDGTFEKSDFVYNHDRDAYICPVGLPLYPAKKVYRNRKTPISADNMIRYRASKYDCQECILKKYCCPNQPVRNVGRHIYEGARDLARKLSLTDAYVDSQRRRKKVEMLFAHLKRINPATWDSLATRKNSSSVGCEERWSLIASSPTPMTGSMNTISPRALPVSVVSGK